jgi:hypothetical protein
MNRKTAGILVATGALAVLAWGMAGAPGTPLLEGRAHAQGGEGAAAQAKAGRYQIVSSPTIVLLLDHTTGKTYALSPSVSGPGPRGRDGAEFAWMPVPKFEEIEGYRRWLQERRGALFRERGPDPRPEFKDFKRDEKEKKDKFEEKKFEDRKDKQFEEKKEKRFEEKKDKEG